MPPMLYHVSTVVLALGTVGIMLRGLFSRWSRSGLYQSLGRVLSRNGLPDFAQLTGSPAPRPLYHFEIDRAKPRPYRPFRWEYHQNMCTSLTCSYPIIPLSAACQPSRSSNQIGGWNSKAHTEHAYLNGKNYMLTMASWSWTSYQEVKQLQRSACKWSFNTSVRGILSYSSTTIGLACSQTEFLVARLISLPYIPSHSLWTMSQKTS